MSRDLSSLTDCGLAGIKDIPFGVHMCHFYESREALAAALVPYFAAGLRNHERCMWICAEPLPAAQAKRELANAGVDVAGALQSGALVVRDFSEWYAEAGALKGTDVVGLWLAEEERALAQGYKGLRITGNVNFLSEQTWPLFMEYEAAVNEAFHGRRIVTLCSYPAHACGAAERLEVAHRHNCALDRPDEGWQILTPQAEPAR